MPSGPPKAGAAAPPIVPGRPTPCKAGDRPGPTVILSAAKDLGCGGFGRVAWAAGPPLQNGAPTLRRQQGWTSHPWHPLHQPMTYPNRPAEILRFAQDDADAANCPRDARVPRVDAARASGGRRSASPPECGHASAACSSGPCSGRRCSSGPRRGSAPAAPRHMPKAPGSRRTAAPAPRAGRGSRGRAWLAGCASRGRCGEDRGPRPYCSITSR